MRLIILLTIPLGLAACNNGDTAQNRAEAERNVTTQVAATNDTTAIDAATGEAANMAADVDFMPEDMNSIGNEDAPASPGTTNTASRSRPEPEAADPQADTGDE